MLGWLLSSFVARRMRAIEFPDQGGPDAGANTTEILETFLDGADAGARLESAAQLTKREEGVPWFRRPFFWEGYGLGLCVRHAATFSRKNPLRAHVGEGYRYMFYTGMGFYNGVAASEGMPQIPAEGPLWADDPGHRFGRLLIAGGDSFARIASGRQWNAELIGPLLEGRDAMTRALEAQVVPRAQALGVAVHRVGVKDVVLPGEMKTTENSVYYTDDEY